ncbi:hypothetical protein O3M35_002873 [Rhynocoris fuscipes]
MTRSCVHDIPVRIIHIDYWREFKEPPVLEYSATIEIGNLKKVRNVIERLKKLCPYIKLGTSQDGFLCMAAESQAFNCITIFKNAPLTAQIETDEEICARIDAKKLHQLLCCELLNSKKTLLHFHNKTIHFNLNCDHFFIHFHLASVEE